MNQRLLFFTAILTAGWVVYRYMVLGMDSRKIALAAIAGFMFGTAIIILAHLRAILMEREVFCIWTVSGSKSCCGVAPKVQ